MSIKFKKSCIILKKCRFQTNLLTYELFEWKIRKNNTGIEKTAAGLIAYLNAYSIYLMKDKMMKIVDWILLLGLIVELFL